MFGDFFKSKEEKEKEMMRAQKRESARSQRELDHERLILERQEKQLIADIKKLAAKGQNSSAKTLAMELVRVRKQKEKLLEMKYKVSAVQTRSTTMKATQQSAKALAGATSAMAYTNASMSLPAMQKTSMDYQKESDMLDMKGEMMDDLFENDEEDEEADEVLDQIGDEIGLDLKTQMPSAQKGDLHAHGEKEKASKGKVAIREEDVDDEDLKKMLAQLK